MIYNILTENKYISNQEDILFIKSFFEKSISTPVKISDENYLINKNKLTNIFKSGLSLDDFLNIEIEYNNEFKKLKDINTWVFKDLMEDNYDILFNNNFLIINDIYKSEFIKALRNNFLSQNWLTNYINKENNYNFINEVYLNTNNHKVMMNIAKYIKINPWFPIEMGKEEKFETLWPIMVFNNELKSNNIRNKTYYTEKFDYYIDTIDNWINIETKKTKNIDFRSRVIASLAITKEEKILMSFIKDTKIKEINFNCKSGINNLSIKDLLIKHGKLKVITKFNKKVNNVIDITDLVSILPAQANLISVKKIFIKNLEKCDLNFNDEIANNVLSAIIKTKKQAYDDSEYSIKCYFPLKSAQILLINKFNGFSDSAFLDFGTNSSYSIANTSFTNLLDVINEKNNNYFVNLDKNKLYEIFSLSSQIEQDRTVVDYFFKENGFFNKLNLTKEKKNFIGNEFLKNWENIFTKKLKTNLEYGKNSYGCKDSFIDWIIPILGEINIQEKNKENFKNFKESCLSVFDTKKINQYEIIFSKINLELDLTSNLTENKKTIIKI